MKNVLSLLNVPNLCLTCVAFQIRILGVSFLQLFLYYGGGEVGKSKLYVSFEIFYQYTTII